MFPYARKEKTHLLGGLFSLEVGRDEFLLVHNFLLSERCDFADATSGKMYMSEIS